jgi:pyruvate dehydrogenase E2 component (dihydrolipoamide acetyltransferase)
MAVDLFVPKMGQTVEEVTLINWLIEEGTKVDFGDPVMEVETDKAIFTVEANGKGYVHFGPFEKGQVVPVLTVVATIGKKDDSFAPSTDVISTDEKPAEAEKEAPKAEAPAEEEKAAETAPAEAAKTKVFASPRAKKLANAKGVDLSKVSPTGGEGVRVVEADVMAYLEKNAKSATPIAAKLADEMALDLSGVTGTGPKGTITRGDVEKAIRQRMAGGPAVGAAMPASADIAYAPNTVVDNKPVSGVRKIVFDRMGLSDQLTARVTLVTEADVTELVRFRNKLKADKAEAWGFKPGYNEMIGLIVAKALKEYPYMNARLSQDGSQIEYLEDINLGFAADSERGLLVPVVKKAGQMDLQALGAKFHALAEGAKSGRISPDDLVGGTFTITNLGSYGVDAFTPVINLPELAILGLGRIQDKVVPVNGKAEIRKMMTLSLVFDHRLVDGAPAAKFLAGVKSLIEYPVMIFV